MNTTINLGIDQSNTISYILQLSHNERWEVFLRPLWGTRKPSYFYDGLNMSERDIRNIDHISFHEDGTIHITYKDLSGNKDHIFHYKLPGSLKTMPATGYGVLLVYSIYDFALVKELISKPSALKFKGGRDVSLHVEHPNRDRFSIVVFLLGAELDAKHVLETHFPNVFNLGRPICIQDYLVDEENQDHPNVLQLLVAVTEKVLQRPSSDGVGRYKKSKKFPRIEVPMGISLACSDDHIRSMV